MSTDYEYLDYTEVRPCWDIEDPNYQELVSIIVRSFPDQYQDLMTTFRTNYQACMVMHVNSWDDSINPANVFIGYLMVLKPDVTNEWMMDMQRLVHEIYEC